MFRKAGLNPPRFLLPARGFTIMEIMVVLAVFSVVAVVTADIFFTITRAQRRVVASQGVQGNIRFAFDAMVREVSQGSIDYAYYDSHNPRIYLSATTGGWLEPQSTLALRDTNGQAVRFAFDSANNSLKVCRGSCATMETMESITAGSIKVQSAKFYIVPASDPFALGVPLFDSYPRVTMVLSAQTKATNVVDPKTVFLQTTVALRSYRR